MRKWRDLRIGSKLAVSYFILIFVFFIAGAYTIIGLYNYKKELLATTKGYIPLVDNTNKIERLTNQVMQFLWEFTVLGDKDYYDLGKNTLIELKHALEETESIISSSPELNILNSRLLRVNNWILDLEMIIDETLEVKTRLQRNQVNFNRISDDFGVEARQFLYEGENILRNEFQKDLIPSGSLYNRHRKNRIINLILDKGNNNMIIAFEAIANENPEHLNPAFKEFVYINNLINVLDSLSVEEFEFQGVKKFKDHFGQFRNELYSLKQNLTKSRELSIRRGEIATVVIFEARAMGQDGINFAGKTLQDNYQVFRRSVPAYFLGLILALIMAVVFSIMITRSITIPLGKSSSFAEEIASGNLDAFVDIRQNDEVGILARSLKYMGAKLKTNMEELKRAKRKMLSLSIETEEKEKKRMADDLHDSLGPQLSIIKLYIEALKNNDLPLERKHFLIDSSAEAIEEAISQAKIIAYNLLPNLLSDFGLDMAIRSFCKKINEVNKIKVTYSSSNYPTDLDRHTETMLFRVIKELINNTLKHANAKIIDIKLSFVEKKLMIDYYDNGKGFDPGEVSNTEKRGLTNIYSRINYISGKINLESKPGKGTRVRIMVEERFLQ
jgi:signal transduction histidine kinase